VVHEGQNGDVPTYLFTGAVIWRTPYKK